MKYRDWVGVGCLTFFIAACIINPANLLWGAVLAAIGFAVLSDD